MFRAIMSEFQKLRSLKSTWIIFAVSIFMMAVFAAGYAYVLNGKDPGGALGYAAFPIWKYSTSGMDLVHISLSVLAILAVTSEYQYGTIATTFLSTQNRAKVLLSKLIAIVATCTAMLYFCQFFCFSLIYAMSNYARNGMNYFDALSVQADIALGSHVFGVIALITIAAILGFLFRNAAGAIITYVLATTMLSTLASAVALMANSEFGLHAIGYFPDRLVRVLSQYVPISGNAGEVGVLFTSEYLPSVPVAFASLSAYLIVGIVAALILLKKRDA